jgi:hypothetical protein
MKIFATNFAAVAMETKKGGFKKLLDSFHQTSCNFVGISTVVCDSSCGVEKKIKMAVFSIFQHFGRFHGNGSHFEKNKHLKTQLHMAYDIPTRFHKV